VTIHAYPPGTTWTYRNVRDTTVVRTGEVALSWEPDACWVTDDYLASEISPRQLWDLWVPQVENMLHDRNPARYVPGDVHINWTVVHADDSGPFETAPYLIVRPDEKLRDNFLTFFTNPVNVKTGEELNWARVPVRDKGWNATAEDKGGFIQELLGWKPAPLQPTMNVHQLAAAAGLT
jgi:hypothetical protein